MLLSRLDSIVLATVSVSIWTLSWSGWRWRSGYKCICIIEVGQVFKWWPVISFCPHTTLTPNFGYQVTSCGTDLCYQKLMDRLTVTLFPIPKNQNVADNEILLTVNSLSVDFGSRFGSRVHYCTVLYFYILVQYPDPYAPTTHYRLHHYHHWPMRDQ
jgi:hypothetical protein